MSTTRYGWCFVAAAAGMWAAMSLWAGEPTSSAPTNIEYNRDIRPILSEHCVACHGPDKNKREADLRLDTRAGALADLGGYKAIVPGQPEESELFARITAEHEDDRMPPRKYNRPLNDQQIELLKRWIEQGAEYQEHWSFIAPKRHDPPVAGKDKLDKWARNEIDRFIGAKLEAEGLEPSAEADKPALIRRATFDLTGLPPTPAEIDAYLADGSPDAYEKVVDRLLASPKYGERMAMTWLDLARYADTHGYHIDSHRDMWRWREWVIEAYNGNMPFDQFTVEQIAGDLLPNATLSQQIATGFNRNAMVNFEGGAIPEEYLNNYIVDRVNTTATVWMGLTMQCAQCHDHKYDPITQKEFYEFYAFFHNVPENGLDGNRGNAKPFIKAPTQEQAQRQAELGQQAAMLESNLADRAAAAAAEQAKWEAALLADRDKAAQPPAGLVGHYTFDEPSGNEARDAIGKQPPGKLKGKAARTEGKVGSALKLDGGNQFVDAGDALGFERTDAFSYGAWVKPANDGHMAVVARMDDGQQHRGYDLYLGGGQVFVHMIHQWDANAIRVNTKQPIKAGEWRHVFMTYDGSSKAAGVKVYLDGQPVELDVTHDRLTETIRTDKPLHIGRRNPGANFNGLIDDVRFYDRALTDAEVASIVGANPFIDLVVVPADQRNDEQRKQIARYYLENHDEAYRAIHGEAAAVRKQLAELDAAIPTTMVMQEMDKPRETFILKRGQYDLRGEKVGLGTPSALPPLPQGEQVNRLTLARWLTQPDHPLTARVAANRVWQMLFGTGLVKTSEDFGAQGEWPSHPELLDWLATEYVRLGWDTKALQKRIMMSATYRQASRVTPTLIQRDPENRLLARGPRFRMPGEMIRDQALAVSGLLVDRIGGPSVKPYQPEGIWRDVAYGGDFTAQVYVQDHGEALYRRSIYTFWKRSCPPPTMLVFGAPEREFCTVRRPRTNTPLQALVLMNDPTFVEAARHLAERMMRDPAARSPEHRVALAFRLATGRIPTDRETRVMLDVYERNLAEYRADAEAAKKLLSVGESARDESLDLAEHAAWTTIANMILTLDEAITKG